MIIICISSMLLPNFFSYSSYNMYSYHIIIPYIHTSSCSYFTYLKYLYSLIEVFGIPILFSRNLSMFKIKFSQFISNTHSIPFWVITIIFNIFTTNWVKFYFVKKLHPSHFNYLNKIICNKLFNLSSAWVSRTSYVASVMHGTIPSMYSYILFHNISKFCYTTIPLDHL